MKKLPLILLIIGAVILLACGAYLWANSISTKEWLASTEGVYTLTFRRIDLPRELDNETSLHLDLQLPAIGEQIAIKRLDNGLQIIPSDSSSTTLQQLSPTEWQMNYTSRTWFDFEHSIEARYWTAIDEHLFAAHLFARRRFCQAPWIGFSVQLPDPTNNDISYYLVFEQQAANDL